jgi:hypothetical protein
MMTLAKRIGMAALAVAAMDWSGSAVLAQRRLIQYPFSYNGPPINRNWLVAPGLNIRQATYNTAMWGRAYSYIPPYMLGYNPYPQVVNYGPNYGPVSPYAYNPYVNPYANPYTAAAAYSSPYASLYSGGYGLGGYGGGSALSSATGLPTSAGYDGYGGANPYTQPYNYPSFLSGAADVINSQGKLVIQLEQAKLQREQAHQASIDTRRRLFDEIMYERAHTPTFTERQEKIAADTLRRSLNVAPVTEIYSGKALNDILNDLKKLRARGIKGTDFTLEPGLLKQVNLAGGAGNIGSLRNGGKLKWPQGLRDLKPAGLSRDLRDDTVQAAQKAVDEAKKEKAVNPGRIRDLRNYVDQLHKLLARNVNELSANDYIEAKRFLNNLDDAIRALQDPNVGNYFNKTYSVVGTSVEALVDNMLKKGLRFAPAVAGDEPAYQALHNALAAYDQTLHAQVPVAKEEKDKEEKD